MSKICITLSGVPRNLALCKPEFRCENPNYYIVSCGVSRAFCNVRCVRGTPRISSSECGVSCPKGYFVKTVYSMSDPVVDKCHLHKKCLPEESVVLAGSSWHDTICGRPGELRIRSLVDPPDIKTLEVLDRLAVLWMAKIPDTDFVQVCKHLSPSTPPDKCGRVNLNGLFSAEQSTTHQLYYALHALSLYASAEYMFTEVIRPFNSIMTIPKYPTIERSKYHVEVDVVSSTVLVKAVVSIPLDPRFKCTPIKVTWWREYMTAPNVASHATLLTVENGYIRRQDPRCDLTKNFRWPEPYDMGFLSYAMDVSVIIKHPHSNRFVSLQVELEYYITYPNGVTEEKIVTKDIPLRYVWKHKRHADCMCDDGDGIEYTDPPGPCSPTCIPYTRIIPGLPGTNNDWTLQVSYNHNRIAPWKSRVVHGVTRLNTKKYCLITPELFSSPDGPSAEAPAAPVDVLSCDVVLLEFQVPAVREPYTSSTGNEEFSRNTGCVTIHVTSQSQPSLGGGEICVPTSVNRTMAVIRRQGWLVTFGAKITFRVDQDAVNPTQEELSAVLNWLSIITPEVQTVVVDMNLENRDYLQLDAVSKVYGSRFEFKPGFTSTALSQLMMTTDDIAHNTTALTFKEGDSIYMGQTNPSVRIVAVTWKHNYDMVVEWYQGAPPMYFRKFRGRTKLNTETGVLEFTNLITSDTGVYTVEMNNNVQPQRYNVIVIPTVPLGNTLQELGAFVARHGAFLELTNVRNPSGSCDTPNPCVWRSGKYYGDEHDLKIDAVDAITVKGSGVYVFDELSRLSNNRAGIIVSLPSSAYAFKSQCTEPAMRLHRNLARSANTVMYTTHELSALALDMAKWGVSKYGLGYLDHTFVVTNNLPMFVVLAEAVELAASRFRTLRYSYVRDPGFGDGGYSAARVNGIYKLEAGLFFRRVSSSDSHSVKSFVSIPGVPGLEVGLSSDMNVGVSLPVSKLTLDSAAVKMSYLPYGAKTVSVQHSGVVVFVDRERDVVCYHVLPKLSGGPIRTPAIGVVTKHEANVTALGSGCVHSVPGDRRYVKLAFTLPASTDTDKRSIIDQIPCVDEPQNPPMSTEDIDWLSATNDTQRYEYRPNHEKGQAALYDEMHTISLVTQCLRGYSACIALASIIGADWPQGGTGYPIAVRAFAVSEGVLLKIILTVSHGAVRVNVSCDLEPFALSSRDMKYTTQIRGYYQRKERSHLTQVSTEIARIQTVADYITRAITLKVCSTDTRGHPEWYKESALTRATYCVSETERLIAEGSETVSMFGAVVHDGEARLRAHGPRLVAAKVRVGALSWVATILAVLINIVCVVILWLVCANARSNQYRYRKLQ